MIGSGSIGPPLAACVLAAAAVALLLPWSAPVAPAATGPRSRWPPVLSGGVALGVLGLLGTGIAVPVTVCLFAAVVGHRLWARGRRRRRIADTSGQVRESLAHLASELLAGQPPGRALALVRATWPGWSPVSAAHDLGADVPAAIRAAAAEPGAGDLRVLAAAWEVSSRTGQGLAVAVGRVSDDLDATERTRRVVDSELASARATARIVAALPVAAWLMAPAGVTGPPQFLVGQPAGWLVLTLGLALGLGGLWWIEVITGQAELGR